MTDKVTVAEIVEALRHTGCASELRVRHALANRIEQHGIAPPDGWWLAPSEHIETILKIGNLVRTQDNRITDQPIFVVEKSVMIPISPEYGYDAEEWVNTDSADYERANETKSRRLNLLAEDDRKTGAWEKFYLKETWEFVTCCFTEAGCLNFLSRNGHNIGKNRIYAYGSYRNNEWQTVRNFLKEMPAAAQKDKP